MNYERDKTIMIISILIKSKNATAIVNFLSMIIYITLHTKGLQYFTVVGGAFRDFARATNGKQVRNSRPPLPSKRSVLYSQIASGPKPASTGDKTVFVDRSWILLIHPAMIRPIASARCTWCRWDRCVGPVLAQCWPMSPEIDGDVQRWGVRTPHLVNLHRDSNMICKAKR